jgi:hypothetical protein
MLSISLSKDMSTVSDTNPTIYVYQPMRIHRFIHTRKAAIPQVEQIPLLISIHLLEYIQRCVCVCVAICMASPKGYHAYVLA